jgi:hypothetical protein
MSTLIFLSALAWAVFGEPTTMDVLALCGIGVLVDVRDAVSRWSCRCTGGKP